MHPNPFKPLITVSSSGKNTSAPLIIAASTTAASGVLPGTATEDVNMDIRVENQTTGWAYLVFSDASAIVATASNGFAVAPGSVEVFEIQPYLLNVSVLLSTGTGNVRFTRGLGI